MARICWRGNNTGPGTLEGGDKISDEEAIAIKTLIDLIGSHGEPKILRTQEKTEMIFNEQSIKKILSAA